MRRYMEYLFNQIFPNLISISYLDFFLRTARIFAPRYKSCLMYFSMPSTAYFYVPHLTCRSASVVILVRFRCLYFTPYFLRMPSTWSKRKCRPNRSYVRTNTTTIIRASSYARMNSLKSSYDRDIRHVQKTAQYTRRGSSYARANSLASFIFVVQMTRANKRTLVVVGSNRKCRPGSSSTTANVANHLLCLVHQTRG